MNKMSDSRFSQLGAFGLTTVMFAAAVSSAVPVCADDTGTNWIRFNGRSVDKVAAQTHDRAFVREWEANPPRGYPTLSRDNIEPTKKAIEQYAEIVKEGGWKAFPIKSGLRLAFRIPVSCCCKSA